METAAILLLAGGRERRARLRDRTRTALAGADFDRLADELTARRLLPLLGTRALAVAGDLAPPGFRSAVEQAVAHTRAQGLAVEATMRRAVGALEAAGIRALPLKGPVLAQDAHGDLGLRDTCDVDLLVDPAALDEAVRALGALGFRRLPAPAGPGGRPELHHALVHASFAPVEVHWRVHWYEDEFSRRMLARAVPGDDGLLRAQPDDLAASLLLFHARDGLVGVRLAADLAAWWDRHGDGLAPTFLEGHARAHAALAPALTAAAVAAEQVTGTPATAWLGAARARDRRVARAIRLADWSERGDRDQRMANVALMDALLGPRGSLRGFARRELRLRGEGAAAALAHPAKMAVRWAWALWRVRGGRTWDQPVRA